MNELYLPNVHWFAMNNSFSGSCGLFRFMARPKVIMATAKEVDFEQSSVHVECWHGKLCYELSQMEAEADFPLNEDGLADMKDWLLENI